jgi:hypothetical protein
LSEENKLVGHHWVPRKPNKERWKNDVKKKDPKFMHWIYTPRFRLHRISFSEKVGKIWRRECSTIVRGHTAEDGSGK